MGESCQTHRKKMKALIEEARVGMPETIWGADAKAIASLVDNVARADAGDETDNAAAPLVSGVTWGEHVGVLLNQIRAGYEDSEIVAELMRCARIADVWESAMSAVASQSRGAGPPPAGQQADRAEREFRDLASAIRRGDLTKYSEATVDRILRDSGRDRGALRDLIATGPLQER